MDSDKLVSIACKNGDLELLKTLHAQGANINHSKYINNVLRDKRYDIACYLIESGINTDMINCGAIEKYFKPTQKLITHKSLKELNAYIEKTKFIATLESYNIKAVNSLKFTIACKKGDVATCHELLNLNVDAGALFRQACMLGNLDIIIKLHELGANIRRDNDRYVRVACDNGNLRLLQWLYEHGCDIRCNKDYGIRVSMHNKAVMEFLLSHMQVDNNIFVQICAKATYEVFEMSLKYVGEYDIQQCIDSCCQNNDEKIVEYFIDNDLCMLSDNMRAKITRYAMEYGKYDLFMHMNKLYSGIKSLTLESYLSACDYKTESNFIEYFCTHNSVVIRSDSSKQKICYSANYEKFIYLRQHGLQLDEKYMQYAIKNKNTKLINYLISHGVN